MLQLRSGGGRLGRKACGARLSAPSDVVAGGSAATSEECSQGHRRVGRAIAQLCVVACLLGMPAGAALAQGTSMGILQATYLGGRGQTDARAVAVDPGSGDVILAGSANFADIPGTAGGAQPGYAGAQDGWIARLSPDLRTLRQATYLGGSAPEQIDAVAVDPDSGDVLVAGFTSSSDFPAATGGAQEHRAGSSDVFVARLSADLRTIRQATYLGGTGDEGEALLGIAIDPHSGQVVVAGSTASNDFPGTAGGAQSMFGATSTGDGFIARLSGNLKTLVQATYVSGGGRDVVYDVVIHPLTGDVLVGGYATFAGRHFGVVTCVSANLKVLKGIAELGGAKATFTNVWGLAIDPVSGDVVAAGETSSALDGVQRGAQPTFGGGSGDAFVARFTQDLFPLQATYLGGSDYDGGIVKPTIQPATGEVVVSGWTQSHDFPATAGGAQAAPAGGLDSFVARLGGSLKTLAQATYLGGSDNDHVYRTAVVPGGAEVIAAGYTGSTDFPATAGGAQPSFAVPPVFGGPTAAFAARISTDLRAGNPTPTATLAPTATPTPIATPTDTVMPLSTASATPTAPGGCVGDCSGDGKVSVDDLIKGVNIALGSALAGTCTAIDANADGRVTVSELVRAVGNALNGCA